jgi:hypothetical protein
LGLNEIAKALVSFFASDIGLWIASTRTVTSFEKSIVAIVRITVFVLVTDAVERSISDLDILFRVWSTNSHANFWEWDHHFVIWCYHGFSNLLVFIDLVDNGHFDQWYLANFTLNVISHADFTVLHIARIVCERITGAASRNFVASTSHALILARCTRCVVRQVATGSSIRNTLSFFKIGKTDVPVLASGVRLVGLTGAEPVTTIPKSIVTVTRIAVFVVSADTSDRSVSNFKLLQFRIIFVAFNERSLSRSCDLARRFFIKRRS